MCLAKKMANFISIKIPCQIDIIVLARAVAVVSNKFRLKLTMLK